MSSYLSRYIGAARLPRNLSDFDVDIHFQLSPESVEAIRDRFEKDRKPGSVDRMIAMAAQVVFMRTTGRTLDSVSLIPAPLLRHIGAMLSVATPNIASLRAIYRRRMTAHQHQLWAREHLGLQPFSDEVIERVREVMAAHAGGATTHDELMKWAQVWLHEQKILIPGDRRLRELAADAFMVTKKDTLRLIKKAIPAAQIKACCKEIFSLRSHGQRSESVVRWLKTPPRRHSPSTGAFSSRKSRKDFPDALILSSACAVAPEYEHFHLVTADEHLRAAAGRFGMEFHESLLQFLDAPAIREAREALATEQKIRELSDAFLSVENLDRIAGWLRAGNDEIEDLHLEHEDIDGLEAVGVTVYGATIDYPVPEAIKFLTISLASPSGDDKWALSLSFETQCEVTFATSWPESMKLENERDVTVESADDLVELRESWWARFDAEIIVDTTRWQPGVDTMWSMIETMKPELLVNRAMLVRPV